MEPPNLYPVKLYVYDLSKGLARRLSPIMLGEGAGVRWEGRQEPGKRMPAGHGGERWALLRERRRAQRLEGKAEWRGMGLGFGLPEPRFPIFAFDPGRRDRSHAPPPTWGLERNPAHQGPFD